MKRRQFLTRVAGGAGGFVLTIPVGSCNFDDSQKVEFGICTDIHQDIIHDAPRRLRAFLGAAEKREVDFVIDLGDFCFPIPKNREFLESWARSPLEKHNVLGNHDMDKGTKQDFMQFVGMPERYYSFDKGSMHYVVLDANNIFVGGEYQSYDHGNFYRPANERGYVDPPQLEWLKKDLSQTTKRCIIFSHPELGECPRGLPEWSGGKSHLGRSQP